MFFLLEGSKAELEVFELEIFLKVVNLFIYIKSSLALENRYIHIVINKLLLKNYN